MSGQVVQEIFNKLDKTSTLTVRRRVRLVETFLSKLREGLAKAKGLLRGSMLLFNGNGQENLAVNIISDFDVPLMLGQPFVAENFTVYYDGKSDLFVLGWRKSKKLDFADKEDFLKAQRLHNKIFAELRSQVESVVVPGATVRSEETPAALTITIHHKNEATRVHLTPMIPARLWGECPMQVTLQELPETVQRTMEALSYGHFPVMFFSLAVAQRRAWDDGHRFTDVSCDFLENYIIMSNTELRDMVRLLKLVADRSNWYTKYGFQSSHLHRLTIKYADHLKDKTTWEGYSTLLKFLYTELHNWTLDHVFFKDRPFTHSTHPKNPADFQDDLAVVMDYRPCKVRSLV